MHFSDVLGSKGLRCGAIVLACAGWMTTAGAPTGPTPMIFAPGVISGPANDGSPSFTPDGKTVFFTRSGTSAGTILESHLVDGHWTSPEIAPFSGQWNDQHAAVAPDGSYLVFVSTRPVAGIAERVAHIWRADRTGNGWGTPQHVSATVNIGPRIFAPSIAADGTIYFLSIGDGRTFQLFRSRNVNGVMQPAEKLSFSSPATADVDPEIAPDQSFLVFASAGRLAVFDDADAVAAVDPGSRFDHLVVPFDALQDDAAERAGRGKGLRAARAGRRRLSHGSQVELHSDGSGRSAAQICDRQRR